MSNAKEPIVMCKLADCSLAITVLTEHISSSAASAILSAEVTGGGAGGAAQSSVAIEQCVNI